MIVIKLWKLDIFIPYITFIITIIATTIVSIFDSFYKPLKSRDWFIMQMILIVVKIVLATFLADETFDSIPDLLWIFLYIIYYLFDIAIIGHRPELTW